MKDMLFFDKMITTKIITFIYWLLLLSALFGGLSTMFGGYQGFTFGKFFLGLLLMAGGAIGARIWCELLIVLFKMNEALQAIKNK